MAARENCHSYKGVEYTSHAIMKIREHCFEGEFEETPMTIAKGHLAMESAIPSSEDAYKQRNKVEEVCDSNKGCTPAPNVL